MALLTETGISGLLSKGFVLSASAFLSGILVSIPAAYGQIPHGISTPSINDMAVLEHSFSEHPASRRHDTLTIMFIGDVMLHKAQIQNASRLDGSFDFSACFSGISEDIGKADIAVANMEFTLAGKPYTGYPAFSAPDEYAEYMAGCGIDVFLTANNHILDKGGKGLVRTLDTYGRIGREYGTRVAGSAKDAEDNNMVFPLIVEADGLRIALINFTYGTNIPPMKDFPGTNYIEKEKISKAVAKAERLGAGLIIALPHWGEEYRTSHSRSQEELAEWMAGLGVDLIVGTHPHVVQDTGLMYDGKDGHPVHVIYSLGNSISNMSAEHTQIGLMLEVRIARNGCGEVTDLSPEYTFLWTSLPGRLSDSHRTVKVKDYIGRKDCWTMQYEYDKMLSTYYKIKKITGIED